MDPGQSPLKDDGSEAVDPDDAHGPASGSSMLPTALSAVEGLDTVPHDQWHLSPFANESESQEHDGDEMRKLYWADEQSDKQSENSAGTQEGVRSSSCVTHVFTTIYPDGRKETKSVDNPRCPKCNFGEGCERRVIFQHPVSYASQGSELRDEAAATRSRRRRRERRHKNEYEEERQKRREVRIAAANANIGHRPAVPMPPKPRRSEYNRPQAIGSTSFDSVGEDSESKSESFNKRADPAHSELEISQNQEETRDHRSTDSFEPVPAAPPTDSAYGSGPAMAGELEKLKICDVAVCQPTSREGESDLDETATVYSYASSTGSVDKQNYIWELAESIFGNLNSLMTGPETPSRISSLLPTLLQEFALKLGYSATSQRDRDVMVFVHKYR